MDFKRYIFAATLGFIALFSSTQSFAVQGYLVTDTNLRAGPGLEYPRTGAFGNRGIIEIFGCLPDYSWCDVSAYRSRGWINGRYLQSQYRGNRVYITEAAPLVYIPVTNFEIVNYWDDNYRNAPFYHDRRKYVYVSKPYRHNRDFSRWSYDNSKPRENYKYPDNYVGRHSDNSDNHNRDHNDWRRDNEWPHARGNWEGRR